MTCQSAQITTQVVVLVLQPQLTEIAYQVAHCITLRWAKRIAPLAYLDLMNDMVSHLAQVRLWY